MNQGTTRRDVVKKITIVVGGVATLIELPARWTKPVVEIDHRASARSTFCDDDDDHNGCTDDNDDNNDESTDVTLRRTGFR